MYFAEHKFDRCQTCFCLIRAASMPTFKRQCRLNLQVLQRQNVATANPQRIQNIQGCTGYKSDLRFIFVRALYLLALFVSRIILQNAHGWARNKTEAMYRTYMQTQHGCCWFHAEVSLRYANSRSADAMEGIPLNSVRDCSDSLFAVCFKQQQLLQ